MKFKSIDRCVKVDVEVVDVHHNDDFKVKCDFTVLDSDGHTYRNTVHINTAVESLFRLSRIPEEIHNHGILSGWKITTRRGDEVIVDNEEFSMALEMLSFFREDIGGMGVDEVRENLNWVLKTIFKTIDRKLSKLKSIEGEFTMAFGKKCEEDLNDE